MVNIGVRLGGLFTTLDLARMGVMGVSIGPQLYLAVAGAGATSADEETIKDAIISSFLPAAKLMQGLPKRPASDVPSCIPVRPIPRTKLALNQCVTLASSPRNRVTRPTHDHACHELQALRPQPSWCQIASCQICSHGAGHSACIESLVRP